MTNVVPIDALLRKRLKKPHLIEHNDTVLQAFQDAFDKPTWDVNGLYKPVVDLTMAILKHVHKTTDILVMSELDLQCIGVNVFCPGPLGSTVGAEQKEGVSVNVYCNLFALDDAYVVYDATGVLGVIHNDDTVVASIAITDSETYFHQDGWELSDSVMELSEDFRDFCDTLGELRIANLISLGYSAFIVLQESGWLTNGYCTVVTETGDSQFRARFWHPVMKKLLVFVFNLSTVVRFNRLIDKLEKEMETEDVSISGPSEQTD